MQQLKGSGQSESWKQLGSLQAECTPWGLLFAERENTVTADLGHLIRKPTKEPGRGKSGLDFRPVTCGFIRQCRDGSGLVTCALGWWFTQQGWRLSSFPCTLKTRAFESISKEHITRSPLILNPWEKPIYMILKGKAQAKDINPRLGSCVLKVFVFLKFWVERGFFVYFHFLAALCGVWDLSSPTQGANPRPLLDHRGSPKRDLRKRLSIWYEFSRWGNMLREADLPTVSQQVRDRS